MQLVAGLPVQVRGRAIRPAYEGIETRPPPGGTGGYCRPGRAIRPAYEGIETTTSLTLMPESAFVPLSR